MRALRRALSVLQQAVDQAGPSCSASRFLSHAASDVMSSSSAIASSQQGLAAVLGAPQAAPSYARHQLSLSFGSRGIATSACSSHGSGSGSASGETISVTYIDKEGKEHTVRAPIGKNLLEVAHDNEIDLEGACEGSLACSTCHLIVENDEYYKKIPEPVEDELDMLDLAFGLTETSRLGCQVLAAKELDGIRVRIPAASRNFYVDGHKPKPH